MIRQLSIMLKCLIAGGMCLNNMHNVFPKQSNGSAELKQACKVTHGNLTGCLNLLDTIYCSKDILHLHIFQTQCHTVDENLKISMCGRYNS